MLPRILVLITVAGLLLSCAERYSNPPVSRFILEKEAVIQPGYDNVFFQFGRITAPAYLEQYEPYCALTTDLESGAVSELSISPGEFSVTGARKTTSFGESYSSYSGQKELVAYQTILRLSSDKQPQIVSLNCTRWALSTGQRFLKLEEIKQIISGVGKII